MPHKGQRTNKQREAVHPHAVDIPIPGDGLGRNLDNIIAAAKTLSGGAETWGHMTRSERGEPQRWGVSQFGCWAIRPCFGTMKRSLSEPSRESSDSPLSDPGEGVADVS